MSKVEVIYSNENNFCQYPSQCEPQRTYAELNCSTNELYSSYSSEIGNSTSMDCFHNRALRWQISPWMKLSSINSLLEEIKPIAQKVLDGYSEVYNGRNYVGVLSGEVDVYEREIERLCDEYSSDPDNLFTRWRWSELVEDRSIEEITDQLKKFGSVEEFEKFEKNYLEEEDCIEGKLIEYLADLVEYADTEEDLQAFPEWLWKLPRIQEALEDGWDKETVQKFVK